MGAHILKFCTISCQHIHPCRYAHASAVRVDMYIVTAGGISLEGFTSTVEILDLTTIHVWKEGQSLPKPISRHSLVNHGTRIVLVGGSDESSDPFANIYQLDCSYCQWQDIGKLQNGRQELVAFPVPKTWTKDNCK